MFLSTILISSFDIYFFTVLIFQPPSHCRQKNKHLFCCQARGWGRSRWIFDIVVDIVREQTVNVRKVLSCFVPLDCWFLPVGFSATVQRMWPGAHTLHLVWVPPSSLLTESDSSQPKFSNWVRPHKLTTSSTTQKLHGASLIKSNLITVGTFMNPPRLRCTLLVVAGFLD